MLSQLMLSHGGGGRESMVCSVVPHPPKLSKTFHNGEAGAFCLSTGQNHPVLVPLSFCNDCVQNSQENHVITKPILGQANTYTACAFPVAV